MAAVTAPVLTLRDLLELACESSRSDGFRSYPRHLPSSSPSSSSADDVARDLLAEPGPDRQLRRSPSRLSLASIFFFSSPTRSGSPGSLSRLSFRSLSRRLREGFFWRRREEFDEDDERDSLGLPSPLVSSCCSDSESEPPDDLRLQPESEKKKLSEQAPATSPSSSGSTGRRADADADATGDGGHKATVGGDDTVEMEEKQQLSPVSVMDFPFHDDGDEASDAGTCSPSNSFQQLQRSSEKGTLRHKIRRLEGLAEAEAAIAPVDLEPRFVASDSGKSLHDTRTQGDSSSSTTTTMALPDEHRSACEDQEESKFPDEPFRLLGRLLDDEEGTAGDSVVATVDERLLLDFFAEGIDRRLRCWAGPAVGTVKRSSLNDHDEAALVCVAREWVRDEGLRWGIDDVFFTGEAALVDMERERRWMRVVEEKQDVGATVAGNMVDALLAELVNDLAHGGTSFGSVHGSCGC
ncbi:uncharacterized protein LOC100845765 [Brachypodium distachyon]|uniref:DUF4378 domain-containing protein n=1 Tax=Brachypodium distachyon TaxID=15368 RepID=I1HAG9_BRADI|nr:uncharacterized protein LOC100845765 [Brachypodium distachyon]KQK23972.1 hypothetical protein BRADI_1g77335v3 [Brachypodium distachyon]|eukprot:XP_003562182.1 uncharacterized protein LOC100845765 [Brachypodium distachyon]